jgi:hypothetical protein
MSDIPSPMPIFVSLTRAERTWLYQLWLSTGGTTSTATDDIDIYLATPTIDNNNTAETEQSLLMQVRDELAEINKKLDEIQINERTILDDVNKRIDDVILLLGGST